MPAIDLRRDAADGWAAGAERRGGRVPGRPDDLGDARDASLQARERQDAGLRRRAAAALVAGLPWPAVAAMLGLAPERLLAAHAVPFDAGESPLKARRLACAGPALADAWRLPGHWQAATPGLAWQARTGPAPDASGICVAAAPGLSAFAVQHGAGTPTLAWLDASGSLAGRWTPDPGQDRALHDFLHRHASAHFGPMVDGCEVGVDPAPAPVPAGTLLPAPAAWDLLLQAAAAALPLAMRVGSGVGLHWHGVLAGVALDGRRLRAEAGPLRLWLAEGEPLWLAAGPDPGAAAGAAGQAAAALLTVAPASGTETGRRGRACAWRRLIEAVQGDRAAPACPC